MNLARVARHAALAAACFIALAACRGADAAAKPNAAAAAPSAMAARDTVSDSALMAAADAGRYEGNPNAPIWVVMVSDFQCPYCKMWHDSTLAEVRRNYVATGKARLAYLNYPLQMHQHARVMATAGMCASAQNKFWPYADSLFARQKAISAMLDAQPALDAIARDVGIDSAQFAHCRKSASISALIQSDVAQSTKGHIQSTPSFFIGPFLVEGAVPYRAFKGAIDSALVLAGKTH